MSTLAGDWGETKTASFAKTWMITQIQVFSARRPSIFQSGSRQFRDLIGLPRSQPHLALSDLLDAELVNEIVHQQGVGCRDRIYSPLVTVWTFLNRVLSLEHCCRKAVACLIAYRTARRQEPCSADSGRYCKARRRLLLGVIIELVRRTAWAIDQRVPEGWL
jgi:hypothetical protein